MNALQGQAKLCSVKVEVKGDLYQVSCNRVSSASLSLRLRAVHALFVRPRLTCPPEIPWVSGALSRGHASPRSQGLADLLCRSGHRNGRGALPYAPRKEMLFFSRLQSPILSQSPAPGALVKAFTGQLRILVH